jgi:hypothetical protein
MVEGAVKGEDYDCESIVTLYISGIMAGIIVA